MYVRISASTDHDKNKSSDPSIFAENDHLIPTQLLFQQAMVPVSDKISRFYHVNDVTRFQQDRPIYKRQIDKDIMNLKVYGLREQHWILHNRWLVFWDGSKLQIGKWIRVIEE